MGTAVRHLVAVVGGGLVLTGLTAPAAAQPSPPGDNGTVKLDTVEFDDHPDNEPHDECVFQVDFYGFDLGEDLDATITFTLVPPTGDNVDILEDDTFIGGDGASGGTDLDASVTFDLADLLADVEPHAQQGIHLRLTVHAEGSQGADTKFKEFWVTGCGKPSPTTSTTASTSSTTSPHQSTSTTSHGGSTTSIKPQTNTVPGSPTTTPGSPPGPGDPDGSVAPAATTVTAGQLPITGSAVAPLVIAALILAVVGVAAGLAARTRMAGRDETY